MSRFDKLKRLKNEVSRLFHEGLNENAVIEQLRADEQFADIGYEQLQAFYSNLQEEFNVKAEKEDQIAENNRQIEVHQQRVAEHQRMKTEIEFMVKYQQKSNKFLIHTESSINRLDAKNFLQGRFLMAAENSDATDNIYTVKLQDLFQNTTKSFTISKHSRLLMFYSLTFPYVLLHEFDSSNNVTYLRLAKFDFESESLQVVQSFQHNDFCQALVNASDASNFLLQKGYDVNECNLVDGNIQIGKKLALQSNFNIYRGSYFDKQLCILKFGRPLDNQARSFPLTQVKMLLHYLERNEHSTQDIDPTPENVVCFHPYNPNYSAWIRDTIFVTVKFPLTINYGVIFTNPQACNWKTVEFAIDLKINCIQAFAKGTLMICAEEEDERSEKEIYKLQMRKPDFLRNMAWITMVKLLKEAKIENPYEEARQYLPLNSEIQSFVFTKD